MCVVICKCKSISLSCLLLIRGDGILQSAGFPYHGQRAIPHGDHLGQAAGLAFGGHQEQIGPCINFHGKGFVIKKIGGKAAGILVLGFFKKVFQMPLAPAQQHKLYRQGHDFRQHGLDQIESLVGGQAGDTGDDGRFRILRKSQQRL